MVRSVRSLRNNRGRDVISYRTLADLGAAGGSGGGGVSPIPPAGSFYVAENGTDQYITESGDNYVTET